MLKIDRYEPIAKGIDVVRVTEENLWDIAEFLGATQIERRTPAVEGGEVHVAFRKKDNMLLATHIHANLIVRDGWLQYVYPNVLLSGYRKVETDAEDTTK